MSKNLTRKGLAFGAGLALVATGLAAMPAQAAAGDVTLAPSVGTGYTVFNTDGMQLTTTVNPFLAGVDETDLNYLISNPDQHTLLIDFNDSSDDVSETLDVVGYDAAGASKDIEDLADFTADNDGGMVVIDFAFHEIVSARIFNFTANTEAKTIEISVLADAASTEYVADGNPDKSTADGYARLGYGGDEAVITVQSWIEASAATLVDTDFASAAETVTFLDPDSVSAISQVVRVEDAYGLPDYDFIVDAATDNDDGDVNQGSSGDLQEGSSTIDSYTVQTDDLVLLLDQDSDSEDGIYTVAAGFAAATNAQNVAALDGKTVYVASGTNFGGKFVTLGLDGNGGLTGTFVTATNSVANTFSSKNASSQSYITGSLRFNKTVNLDQVDLTKWEYALGSSETGDVVDTTSIDIRATNEAFNVANAEMQLLTPAGYSSTNRSAYGKLLFRGAVTANALAASASYNFQFMHTGSATAPKYNSPSFEVVAAATSDADKVFVALNSATNTNVGSYGVAYAVSARSTVGSLTYTAQITDDTNNVAVEDANIPMLAVITAGPNWTDGETLSVSGTSEKVSVADGTMFVTSLTDSDGQWEFTVTSSDATSASAVYEVDVYMLDSNTWTNAEDDETDRGNTATLSVDYATAGASALDSSADVIAAKDVSLTFTIEDAFGEAIAEDSLGRQYSVELTAPDTDDLELNVVATDGIATFAFENYLTTGESEVLTAKVYRGNATSPTMVGLETSVTLFAVTDVAGINVSEDIEDVVIPYVDFITGKSTTANPGPTSGTTYAGTVVDSNGAGIPGAAVTIAADGFQFKSGDLFYMDSVTVPTTSAGTFSVDFWTQVAAKDVSLTVTSGDATETTLVDSKVTTTADTLSRGNLLFSWDLEAGLVMNTTYAVSATVTDIYGNPIESANVTFSAFAAAQFNGVAEVADKSTSAAGEATVFLRSLKDVDGISAVGAKLTTAPGVTTSTIDNSIVDVTTTSWDESLFDNEIEERITFLKSAADLPASGDQKVNVGSFKGYVALYAKGYEGQKMSAIVAGKWIVVESLASDFERVVRFTGAGYTITTKLYIDGVQVGDDFTTLTK